MKAYFHIVTRAFVAMIDETDIKVKTVTVPRDAVNELLWHELVSLCAKQLCEELQLDPRDIEINELKV